MPLNGGDVISSQRFPLPFSSHFSAAPGQADTFQKCSKITENVFHIQCLLVNTESVFA